MYTATYCKSICSISLHPFTLDKVNFVIFDCDNNTIMHSNGAMIIIIVLLESSYILIMCYFCSLKLLLTISKSNTACVMSFALKP